MNLFTKKQLEDRKDAIFSFYASFETYFKNIPATEIEVTKEGKPMKK